MWVCGIEPHEHKSEWRNGTTDWLDNVQVSAISGYRRDADEICALLGYYTVSSGNPLPTFRDNLSVSYPRVKKSTKTHENGADRLSETSVQKYHSKLRNIPEERTSQRASESYSSGYLAY
jgi:hypothetical protein